MARAEGFEPPNASTKNWCLTTWPRPITLLYYTPSSGVRTFVRRDSTRLQRARRNIFAN